MHLQWLREFRTTPLHRDLFFSPWMWTSEMDVRKTGVPQLTAQQPQQGVGARSWVASVRPPPLALPRNLGTAVPQSQRGKTMIIAKDLATWILPAELQGPANSALMSRMGVPHLCQMACWWSNRLVQETGNSLPQWLGPQSQSHFCGTASLAPSRFRAGPETLLFSQAPGTVDSVGLQTSF